MCFSPLKLIRDDKVYWYESFVLLAFYGVYIFFMAYVFFFHLKISLLNQLFNYLMTILVSISHRNNDRFKNMAYEKFKILQHEAQSILPGGLSTPGAVPHNKQFGHLTARRSLSKSQSGYSECLAWKVLTKTIKMI